jgi:hypothetical protein
MRNFYEKALFVKADVSAPSRSSATTLCPLRYACIRCEYAKVAAGDASERPDPSIRGPYVPCLRVSSRSIRACTNSAVVATDSASANSD